MGTIRTFFPQKSVHFFRFLKKDRGGSPPPLVARLGINLKLSVFSTFITEKKKKKKILTNLCRFSGVISFWTGGRTENKDFYKNTEKL